MSELKMLIKLFAKFIGLYLIILVLYTLYLNYYQKNLQTCDIFTQIVAEHSINVSQYFNINVDGVLHEHKNYVNLVNKDQDNKYFAIVNEGCNAISVMIVFLAFIFAFSTTRIKTGLYIICGILILHIMNISRISLLIFIAFKYPKYSKIAHDYLFPAIIYGTVILLWIIWIQLFLSKKNE